MRYISKTFGQGGLDIAYKIDPWLFPEGREVEYINLYVNTLKFYIFSSKTLFELCVY